MGPPWGEEGRRVTIGAARKSASVNGGSFLPYQIACVGSSSQLEVHKIVQKCRNHQSCPLVTWFTLDKSLAAG